MLRTVARSTEVEPGHVRAFELRQDGAEAVGRSRIPLLKTIGVGRSKETRITLANVAGTLYAIDDTCTHKGLLSGRWEARRVHGPVPATGAASTSRAVPSCAVRPRTQCAATPSMSPAARSRSICSWPCSAASCRCGAKRSERR